MYNPVSSVIWLCTHEMDLFEQSQIHALHLSVCKLSFLLRIQDGFGQVITLTLQVEFIKNIILMVGKKNE